MKKIFSVIVIFMICCLVTPSRNVNAACAVSVTVDNEMICMVSGSASKNKNGTAYEEDGDLVLNNYDGGNIFFDSGLGNGFQPRKIKLIGENHIESDSFGIKAFQPGIIFDGDGSLTISSKIPFVIFDTDSREDEPDYQIIEASTTITVLAKDYKVAVSESEESDANNVGEDIVAENTRKGSSVIELLLVIIAITSGLCLALLIIVLFVIKRKNDN